MKNLIMGVAKGYDWNALEPFVTSAKKNCPNAELVLFVNDISDFTRERLTQWGGVYIKDIPAEYKNGSVVNTRWKMYFDFLETCGNDYEKVLVSDVRDVIFQDDIFKSYITHTNFLLCGIHSYKIGEEKTNIKWLTNLFGENSWQAIADDFVICAGVILGTRAEILALLNKMNEFIKNSNAWGDDQAALNYIIRNNVLPLKNIFYSDDKTGILMNTDCMSGEIRNEKILRGDGGVPALVHQWPMFNHMIRLVDRIYRDRNFQVDERFTDTRSALEQIFYLMYANRADDAAQFCMKSFSAKLNRGENLDYLLKFWALLLQKPLTPATGFIELTLQTALKFAKGFSLEQLDKICSLIIHSIKNNRGVEPELKILLVNFLVNIIEQTLNAGNSELCLHFVEVLKLLGEPPNRDFYLLDAKVNRAFGRKEEALAAYKKALDLS